MLTKKQFKIKVLYPLKYEFLFKRSQYCILQFEFAQNFKHWRFIISMGKFSIILKENNLTVFNFWNYEMTVIINSN